MACMNRIDDKSKLSEDKRSLVELDWMVLNDCYRPQPTL